MSHREHRTSSSRRSRRREKRSVSDDSDDGGRIVEVRRRPASASDLRLPEYRHNTSDEKGQKKAHRKEKKITRNTREERTLEYVTNSGHHEQRRPVTRAAYQSDGEEINDSDTGSDSTVRRMKEHMRYYATQNTQAASETGERRIVYYNARNNGRPMSDVGTQLVQHVRQDSMRENRRVSRPRSAFSEQILHTRDGDRLVELEKREEGNKVYYNYRLKEEAKPPPVPVRRMRNVGVQMTTKYVVDQPPPVKTKSAGTQTPAPPPKPRPRTPPRLIRVVRPETPPLRVVRPETPPPVEVMEPVPAVIPKAKSVMVRVGGGWMKVEHHRNHHIPVKEPQYIYVPKTRPKPVVVHTEHTGRAGYLVSQRRKSLTSSMPLRVIEYDNNRSLRDKYIYVRPRSAVGRSKRSFVPMGYEMYMERPYTIPDYPR
ncbi:serine/arginine repetitive matrix protein 1-like isoform X2 [Mizuhopecten yessoensis]|uniref:serine/arginine repetitive matrix protein 1-like isoform X2 n=1 Tax=Mizuhopecten yessoensis TaxID=6573 RepID=UPI000B45F253|nr:serine/arginine repetitive matrix protein 1-like isoform X2 [Mizuhopecten yessoensis]